MGGFWFVSATITVSSVNTNGAATFGTRPPQLFLSRKCPYAVCLYALKVLDHAHVVFGAVSFVQMLQVHTGKTVTINAVLYAGSLKRSAILDFASDNSDGFVSICTPAPGTSVLFSQIRHANATVHAAGGDKRVSVQLWRHGLTSTVEKDLRCAMPCC
jgi:hypothetical protein